jgi:prepilin-type N-terminal cleavage/methylation domain-containing protein
MNEENKKSIKWKKGGKAAYGLTLIELMIVIALIAIVCGIAYPSFQRFAINSNLRTATRDLVADLARLKENSIAESRMYRLLINLGNNNYTLQRCGNEGSVCNGWEAPFITKNLNSVAADIVFNAGNTTETDFRFQTRGTMTPGTVQITNRLNTTGTITVNITGRASVQFNP